DLVAQVHPRAARKVLEFAKVLSKHDAQFAAEFEGRRVSLDSADAVQRVVDALREEDIMEEERAIDGELLGVLPESREFEARLASGQVVRGKLDRAIRNVAAFKKQWENQPGVLLLRVTSVRSNERYSLT